MILTIVSMGCPTANERGYGTTFKRGLRNHYVNTIAGDVGKRHPATAQKGPAGKRDDDLNYQTKELYVIPEPPILELSNATTT